MYKEKMESISNVFERDDAVPDCLTELISVRCLATKSSGKGKEKRQSLSLEY